MANMKEAVAAAAEFVGNLFPEARDIRLEEVEAQSGIWHVVVSFKRDSDSSEPFNKLAYLANSRIFKQVEVGRESGEPVALRIWKA